MAKRCLPHLSDTDTLGQKEAVFRCKGGAFLQLRERETERVCFIAKVPFSICLCSGHGSQNKRSPAFASTVNTKHSINGSCGRRCRVTLVTFLRWYITILAETVSYLQWLCFFKITNEMKFSANDPSEDRCWCWWERWWLRELSR